MNDTASSLLPQDALRGVHIAISVSESGDLAQLGLTETHFKLGIAEIARSVLVGGGKIVYGGHLDPAGYTAFLIQELHRYSRRDRPLHICLAWPEHRRLSLEYIERQNQDLGLFGKIIFLDQEGEEIEPGRDRSNEPQPVENHEARRTSFTALRRYMARHANGRVVFGGKRFGFQGNMPGLLEESIMAVEQGQPLYLAGGFGGVTLDIIKALNPDYAAWFPGFDGPSDDRLVRGLAMLRDQAKYTDYHSLKNGLSNKENARLAATYRPSEIAALVSLGLGRLFSKRG